MISDTINKITDALSAFDRDDTLHLHIVEDEKGDRHRLRLIVSKDIVLLNFRRQGEGEAMVVFEQGDSGLLIDPTNPPSMRVVVEAELILRHVAHLLKKG